MTLKEILTEEGFELSNNGRYLVGQSPFSDSKEDLLFIDEQVETFTDFSTGISGDLIDFLMNLKGVSRETAERLVKGNKEDLPDEFVLKDICKDANDFYKKSILKSNEAKKYLKNRGFTERDIEEYEFGYADNYGNTLTKKLLKKYDREDILKAGICKADKEGKLVDLFWKRLIIPIRDSQGDVVAFGGRVLGDGTPKYINSPESPIFHKREMLFGWHVAHKIECNAYILCEGYMDTIALHKAGLKNAVASLGTALSKMQCELLTDKKRVYVLYDTDTAGINAAKKAIPMLENAGLGTRVIDYSPAKDPDEFLKSHSLKEFKERFDNAENGERYVTRKLIDEDVEKAVKYLSSMSVRKIISLVNQ